MCRNWSCSDWKDVFTREIMWYQTTDYFFRGTDQTKKHPTIFLEWQIIIDSLLHKGVLTPFYLLEKKGRFSQTVSTFKRRSSHLWNANSNISQDDIKLFYQILLWTFKLCIKTYYWRRKIILPTKQHFLQRWCVRKYDYCMLFSI